MTGLQEVPHLHIHVVLGRESGGWGSGPQHGFVFKPRASEAVQQAVVSWEQAGELATLVKANYRGQV